MTERDLKIRTRRLAINILTFADKLPNKRSANIIANQVGRCASSVASNYRAACRARSHAEFVSKIGLVEEEVDESTFWLDIIPETMNSTLEQVGGLLSEARELTAIFTGQQNRKEKQIDSEKVICGK